MSHETTRRILIDKGATIPFAALPNRHAALDGYVQGPAIDATRRRFSFDHHAGCVRHATLSTCEMVLDALRVGLDPVDLTICINDLDSDTVLAAWLLLRPPASSVRSVVRSIRAAGRRDALGPAVGEGLTPALRWALEPMRCRAAELRGLELETWREILVHCFDRLDAWHVAGGPRRSAEMRPPREQRVKAKVLYEGANWRMVEGPGAVAFTPLYLAGVRAAIVVRSLADGSWEYTVGKASEFVSGFDVTTVLAALAAEELLANPSQPEDRNWGGGSTIGGSPRNADGGASRLSPTQVAEIVEKSIAHGVK